MNVKTCHISGFLTEADPPQVSVMQKPSVLRGHVCIPVLQVDDVRVSWIHPRT